MSTSSRRQLIVNLAAGALSLSTAGRSTARSRNPASRRGESIKKVGVGAPIVVPDNFGDTWITAWADDDHLYTPCNDALSFGMPAFITEDLIRRFQRDYKRFIADMTPQEKDRWDALGSLIALTRVEGHDPRSLKGFTVNRMHEYSVYDNTARSSSEDKKSPDGLYWKSSGCAFVDGALYWVIARHKYPDRTDIRVRQHATNASIIKSTDYGRTWTRLPEQNAAAPMFPGSDFATPYFIDYGRSQVAVHGADQYVYAISNNGFWDNGDTLVLGRVRRARMSLLNGADWQFYIGGDGMLDTSWASDAAAARPILERPGKLGETGAVYLPARQRYMMIGWYYPAGSGYFKGPSGTPASTTTVWDFYEAPTPWGPWTCIHSHAWNPQGYYCPGVCPKFQSADRVYVTTAGDFRNWWDHYHLTFVPIDLA